MITARLTFTFEGDGMNLRVEVHPEGNSPTERENLLALADLFDVQRRHAPLAAAIRAATEDKLPSKG